MGSLFKQPVDKRFPELNRKARSVGDFFRDYPHVVIPPDSIYEFPKFEESLQWCKDNCRGFHACEMITTDNWGYDHRYHEYYTVPIKERHITDIGGMPDIYFAFVEETDAALFVLTWC